MNVFLKKDHEEKWIEVSRLSVVWAQAQRGLNEKKVTDRMEDFDPYAFGRIAVTQPNGHGHFHVVDGQHRVEVVRRMYGDSEKVPCIVLPANAPAQAAELWLKVNTGRSAPSAMDRFRVSVTAGREAEVAVERIITDMGYELGFDNADGTISAVSACLAIYSSGGESRLTDVLSVVKATWGMDRDAVHNSILRGVSALIEKHGPEMDRALLARKVAKEYTPVRILGAAKTAREMFRGTIASNIARVMAETYNSGLRGESRLKADR